MEKHRKPDQHYFDQHDRMAIGILKKVEGKQRTYSSEYPEEVLRIMDEMIFYDRGAELAQGRSEVIREWIAAAEEKDRLVQRYPVPKNVRCNTCDTQMEFTDHLFKEEGSLLLFMFTCPNNHVPRKLINHYGHEYFFPVRKCIQCKGKIQSKTERQPDKIICTDVCASCGHEEIMELELDPDPEPPISPEDRKKYCTYFVGKKTHEQSLSKLNKLYEEITKDNKRKEEIKKIEWLTIPQLETRLNKLVDDSKFIKLVFEKPDMKKHVTIAFSIQDPTDRTSKESIKVLEGAMKKDLAPTNWKLMSHGVSYRLGFLEGTLKGQEQSDFDTDIL